MAETIKTCGLVNRSVTTDQRSILRPLALPFAIAGRFWLTSLPDSEQRLEWFMAETVEVGVTHLVVLTEDQELRKLAPAYALALASDQFAFSVTRLPIRDYSIPDDLACFRLTAANIADLLRRGERIVMHCRGGVGRTGLMAQAVLMELGVPPIEAEQQVAGAGSICETAEQIAFLREAYTNVED